jgi:hypothetical protein
MDFETKKRKRTSGKGQITMIINLSNAQSRPTNAFCQQSIMSLQLALRTYQEYATILVEYQIEVAVITAMFTVLQEEEEHVF